jgi:hypothetical protein
MKGGMLVCPFATEPSVPRTVANTQETQIECWMDSLRPPTFPLHSVKSILPSSLFLENDVYMCGASSPDRRRFRNRSMWNSVSMPNAWQVTDGEQIVCVLKERDSCRHNPLEPCLHTALLPPRLQCCTEPHKLQIQAPQKRENFNHLLSPNCWVWTHSDDTKVSWKEKASTGAASDSLF